MGSNQTRQMTFTDMTAPKMDLKDDFMLSHQGSLIHWAKQGVLMIDTALTVNAPTYHTCTQLMKIKLSLTDNFNFNLEHQTKNMRPSRQARLDQISELQVQRQLLLLQLQREQLDGK
jgi:hypothetical protein